MKKWNVAVYLRLSVEDGKDVESNSILNQKSLIDSYIKGTKDLKVYDYYVDDGYSGTNFERPSFIRMMKDAAEKRIDSIIVKDLSRLGRNYIEAGQYLETTFPKLKLRFISVGDNIDSYKRPESINNVIVPFKNLINDDYSRDISNKTKTTLNTKKANGEFLGAFAPYGYLKNPENTKKLIIDPDSGLVVKKIFKDIINGKSKIEVVNDLNNSNILTPSAYLNKTYQTKKLESSAWTTEIIDKIIKNKIYVGDLVQNKTSKVSYKIDKKVRNSESKMIIIINNHKALISEENFKLANKILYSCDIRVKKNNEYNLFAGYIKCGDCNYSMINNKYTKCNRKYNYYECNLYRRKKECSMHKITNEELTKIVLDIVNIQIKIMCNLKEKIEELKNTEQVNLDHEILKQQLRKEENLLIKNKELLKGLESDFKNEFISCKDYDDYKIHYKSAVIKNEDIIKNINKKLNMIKYQPNTYQKVLDNLTNKSKLTKLTRKVMNEMIDTIYIYENNQIKIKFKYNDEYQNILNLIKAHNAVV